MTGRLESFSKWLQLKIYQLEVTLSVYMFTPNEKFIFYSILFLLFSLTLIATILYLPQHVHFILGRAWFYMHGDEVFAHQSQLVKSVLLQGSSGTATAAAAAQAVQTTIAAAAKGIVKGEL
ncbi:hypothetical protein QBC37DRAFT_368110 [Rhypophila decipiens]|uniref:Uncharacterized protein n=1 Tax=Rhypophila decipiens TaxID=261697 RepID=A0AAN7BBA4_9PEZI|nr:hypothetical protein QBC37DRAFT_368110 [Rhypophila decipiens]